MGHIFFRSPQTPPFLTVSLVLKANSCIYFTFLALWKLFSTNDVKCLALQLKVNRYPSSTLPSTLKVP